MGTISASIELYDRMSAPLHGIMTAMNQTIATMYDMQSAMGHDMDTSSLDSAVDTLHQMNAQMNMFEQEIHQGANAQEDLNRRLQTGNTHASDLTNTIKRMVGAYLTIESVKGIMGASDELVTTTTRINLMNDGLQTTPELMNMIYQSAQNARGSFGNMAAVVARFGNNARDAFGSSEEVVQFANIIQKQMKIAGASTEEAKASMLQLSQALGSGVLRGDELNSIFEQAPNLIRSIADYLDVPIGQIRQMASEGQLTADIVKNAMFESAEKVNKEFAKIPMTWGDVWTMFQNSALMAFQPVLNKINELANNQQFTDFVDDAIGLMSTLSVYVLAFFETLGNIAGFISDNWSAISPIIYAVVGALGAYLIIAGLIAAINGAIALSEGIKAAAQTMATGATIAETAAQHGLNAALLACPVTWLVLMFFALIAVVFIFANALAKTSSVANSGFAVITGGINVVIQFFKNLGLTVANIALGIWNALGAVANNMMVAFSNSIANIQSFFYNLLSTVMSVISQIASALNKLPFVEFDASGLASAADSYAQKAADAQNSKKSYESVGDAFSKGFGTFDAFGEGWSSDAFNSGAEWGNGVTDSIGDFFSGGINTEMPTYDFNGGSGLDGINDNVSQIADNTGSGADSAAKLADAVNISEENLKYLRDIAEQEVVNRFTTPEITINQTNHNNVSSDTDIDGMITHLTKGVDEALTIAAEGEHK